MAAMSCSSSPALRASSECTNHSCWQVQRRAVTSTASSTNFGGSLVFQRRYWPRLVHMKTSFGSAGCTATHHGVLFSVPGSVHCCHVRPPSRLARSFPVVPGGPSPLQRKMPLPSALGTTARVYCHGDASFWYCQLTPLSSLECRP